MGGEAQMAVMVLKVDLGCVKCRRKIKRVLCSTPQVRDQLYDDKFNTVTVSALCYTPEKIADKIRRKAGGTVKGIDIKPSQQAAPKPPAEKPKDGGGGGPPPAEKPKQAPAAEKPKPQPQAAPPPQATDKPKSAAPPPADKPKSDDKPKSAAPLPADKPKAPAAAPPPSSDKGGGGPPPQKQQQMAAGDEKPKKADNPPPPQQQPQPQPQQQQMGPPPQAQGPPMMKPNQPAAFESIPVAGYPSIFPPPVMYYDGGPYYQSPGMYPHPQQPMPIYQYDGYQGRPVGDYYGGRPAAAPYRSDYFSEDNPSTCSVM